MPRLVELGAGGRRTCVEVAHGADVAVFEVHHYTDLLYFERSLAQVVHHLIHTGLLQAALWPDAG